VSGFRGRLGVELRTGLSAARAEGILGAADSEVVFAMVLDQLDLGVPMAEALVTVIDRLHEVTDGKFNFLLSDGDTLVATREGNSLFTLERPAPPDPAATDAADPEPADAVQRIVASEPHDDDPAWCEVPDHAVVTVTATDLTVHPR
jgi:glutamine amidotransferase